MTFEPSQYQKDILDFVRKGRGDGVVSAVAGSGKTTTLVEVSKVMGASSCVFFCFNKHIAEALNLKLKDTGMEAKTIHSAGNSALRKAYGPMKLDSDKYLGIIEKKLLELFPYLEASPGTLRSYIIYTRKVVDMSRLTLSKTPEQVMDMITERGIDPGEIPWNEVEVIVSVVRDIVNVGVKMARDGHIIDFTDMIFIPVILKLPVWKYQWVLVDEAQDLNTLQREFVLSCRAPGGRMLFVGDPRQAIMAFAGADAQSYNMIKEATKATELPLSICYRCPSSHIARAKRIVPQIEPRPEAPEGTITDLKQDQVLENVQEGDLLICRTTAPLISTCINLIRNRIPARVRGRDIADMLIKRARLIAKKGPWTEFPRLLEEYKQQQLDYLQGKKNPSTTQIQTITDLCDSLEACYQEFAVTSIQEFAKEVEGIFADDRASVWLSTIHRAKGLEANRVFILNSDMLPFKWKNQSADQQEQESNLHYVALTRSLDTMFLVRSK